MLAVVISVAIVASLLGNAFNFLHGLAWPSESDIAYADDQNGVVASEIGLGRLWGDAWAPIRLEFDLKTILVGSFIVTAVAALVAGPIGIGAAIYLSEYASVSVRKYVKPVLEMFAGLPSVVVGFFALTWLAPNVISNIFPEAELQNLLAAGIGVGLLVVPLIASVTEDALSAVPDSLRQASAGLGARKITTTITVIVPAAVSGIVAALVIGISRAIGETMVVFLAAGASGNQAEFTTDPLSSGSTMTAAIASQLHTDNAKADLPFESLFFVGLLLFIVTLVLNMFASRFVRKVRQAL